MSINLGYACISMEMRERGIFTSRTLTLKSLAGKGIEEARRLALENIKDLITIINFNEIRGIRFFRMSSNMFPHMENPRTGLTDHSLDFAYEVLRNAGKLARKLNHRLTMHPGQFAQIGTPREEVLDQTFRDLTLHARIFQLMGLTPKMGSVMIIHGGGTYGDKNTTLMRWKDNFLKIPRNVSKYIVLENDEWSYSVMDLLPLCEQLSIPLCIDYFHHYVGDHHNQFNIFDEELITRCMNIWKKRGIKPKCHWSNQAIGKRAGTHGACVKSIYKKILQICIKYNCDIMIEAKDKDLCTMKMYQKYFNPSVSDDGRVEWILKEKDYF